MIFYRAVASTTLLMFAIAGLAAAPAEGAADEVPPLRHYVRQTWQTAEGLPQNSVRAIAQTREGYLWFATAEGLVRFDGVRFTVFDRTSTPALPGSNIDSLAVAADGALWIGLRRHGLGRLHAGQSHHVDDGQGLSANEVALAGGDARRQRLGGHGRRRAESHPRRHRSPSTGASRGCPTITATRSRRARAAGCSSAPAPAQRWSPMPASSALIAGRPRVRLSPVGAVLEGDEGDVWFGTTSGLLRLRAGGVAILRVADGLPSDDVVALRAGPIARSGSACDRAASARFRDGRFDTFTGATACPTTSSTRSTRIASAICGWAPPPAA